MPPIQIPNDDDQPLQKFLVSRFRGEKRFVCSFVWSSYHPINTASWPETLRRTSMVFILIAILIFDNYALYLRLINHQYMAFAIWLTINMLFFLFGAFLLAVIGNAVGERVILAMRVVRWHFDSFLLLLVIGQVVLLSSLAFNRLYGRMSGTGLGIMNGGMWALLVMVASVACGERTDVNVVP